MPEIRPFRAFLYGKSHTPKISHLVCPPYDVISPSGRDALIQEDALNFVRVELPEGDPAVRYDAAAAVWKRWLKSGVLRRDSSPAFYVYESRFASPVDGRKLARLGVFAALRVVPWGDGVYPHEKTLPTHKADRLSLFKALRAQTSPIQLLVDDNQGRIRRLLEKHKTGAPVLRFTDPARVEHRLWVWRADKDAKDLAAAFSRSAAAIADGHHRYETARTYGQWAARKWGKTGASQYVMAYFNPTGDAGLEILPTHRAVPWEKRKFVHLSPWGKMKKVSGLAALQGLIHGKKGPGVMDIGLYHRGAYYLYSFTKTPPALLGTAQERFPVAALHAGPLKGLGKEDFLFTRRPEEAVEHAKKTKGWAFFLAPNTVDEVLDTAKSNMVMPPKSTYFYPKIPSGMVSHALQGPL